MTHGTTSRVYSDSIHRLVGILDSIPSGSACAESEEIGNRARGENYRTCPRPITNTSFLTIPFLETGALRASSVNLRWPMIVALFAFLSGCCSAPTYPTVVNKSSRTIEVVYTSDYQVCAPTPSYRIWSATASLPPFARSNRPNNPIELDRASNNQSWMNVAVGAAGLSPWLYVVELRNGKKISYLWHVDIEGGTPWMLVVHEGAESMSPLELSATLVGPLGKSLPVSRSHSEVVMDTLETIRQRQSVGSDSN